MADVITRFKLETTQYESKLRDAAKSLANISKMAEMAGNDFGKFTQKSVEAARALGTTAGGATKARDKVKELVDAYNLMARAYNSLTAQQRQSDFAKAMASSLQNLQGRITQAKQEFYSMGESSKGASNILEQLASKVTVNFDALSLLNGALSMTKTVLDVAKDAFFASEANVDEWGRIVDSSRSLYEGFLTSINTGDISGFLTRIDTIVSAARQAYDALDRLGTMRTIQGPKLSAQQTENERLRMMIQTGRYIAPRDGRRATMAEGLILTPAQIKILERQLQNGMKTAVGLIGNEVDQSSKAIRAIYKRQSAGLGISEREFLRGTSSMAEFDKRVAGANNYRRWQQEHSYVDQKTGRLVAPRTGNPYAKYKGWDVFRVDGKEYNDLVGLIKQRNQQMSQAYGMQAQAYRTINRAEGITTRKIMGGGGGGRSGGHGGGGDVYIPVEGSIDWQTAKVQELQKEYRAAADDDSRKKIKAELDAASKVLSDMTAKTKLITTESLTELQILEDSLQTVKNSMSGYGKTTDEWKTMNEEAERLQKQIDKLNGTPLKLVETSSTGPLAVLYDQLQTIQNSKQNAATADDYRAMSDEERSIQKQIDEIENPKEIKLTDAIDGISSGIGNMVSGIESLGIEMPNGLKRILGAMQGISSILTGISSIITTIQAITTANVFKLSHGGVVRAAVGVSVPGNSYSGDLVPALLNSGETVLNRAQVGNLSSQLNSPRSMTAAQPFVEGDKIFLGINNSLSHSGRGEIVTTSMLRQFGIMQ